MASNSQAEGLGRRLTPKAQLKKMVALPFIEAFSARKNPNPAGAFGALPDKRLQRTLHRHCPGERLRRTAHRLAGAFGANR